MWGTVARMQTHTQRQASYHNKWEKLSMSQDDECTAIHMKQKSKAGKMRACKGAIEFRSLRGTIFANPKILSGAIQSESYELGRI